MFPGLQFSLLTTHLRYNVDINHSTQGMWIKIQGWELKTFPVKERRKAYPPCAITIYYFTLLIVVGGVVVGGSCRWGGCRR